MTNDNVIPFPSMDGWPLIERALRRELKSAGLSNRAIDHVADALEAFYNVLDEDVSFSFAFEGTTDQHTSVLTSVSVAASEAIQAFKNRLWHERLNRELDLAEMLGL